jgi:hypothetical protein
LLLINRILTKHSIGGTFIFEPEQDIPSFPAGAMRRSACGPMNRGKRIYGHGLNHFELPLRYNVQSDFQNYSHNPPIDGKKWLGGNNPDLISSQGSVYRQKRGCHANRHFDQ